MKSGQVATSQYRTIPENKLYLSSSHAVVEVLLWSDSSQESSIDKATSSWTGVIGEEGGEEAPTDHQRGTLALQLNLS